MKLASNIIRTKLLRNRTAFPNSEVKTFAAKAICGISALVLHSQTQQFRALCTAGNDHVKPIIYQYKICPFCNRVKSYLDFLEVEYDTIEVNPLSKTEIKNLDVKTKKVPVAVIDGKLVESSDNIIDMITKIYFETSKRAFDKKSFLPQDTEEWIEWSEKKLAVMLYPNITRSFSESWECFGYASDISKWGSMTQTSVQAAGSIAMYFANGKLKKKYNIIDERKELQDVLDVWINAIKGKKFLHGDQLTLPDVIVFGVLKSVDGLSTFNEIMDQNADLRVWYDAVNRMSPSFAVNVN